MPTRTIVAGAVALTVALATTWILWQIVHVLLVVFAGALLAVIWWNLGQFLAALPGISTRAGTAIVIFLTFLGVAVLVWKIGPLLATQLDQLLDDVTRSASQLQEEVRRYAWGRWILDDALPSLGPGGEMLGRITGAFSTLFGFLGGLVIILMLGIYMALAPDTYRVGLLKLIPKRHRQRGYEVLHGIGQGLWHWLLGQFVAMLCVGIASTLGLWLLGIPLAGVLGGLAGLLNFVPLLGPIVAAVPAVLVAFSQSPTDALYVLLLFIGIQQLESDVLMPLVQQTAVRLPPALVLTSAIVFGTLFGVLGILLATPLTVAFVVLVKMLYIEDVLGDPADAPP